MSDHLYYNNTTREKKEIYKTNFWTGFTCYGYCLYSTTASQIPCGKNCFTLTSHWLWLQYNFNLILKSAELLTYIFCIGYAVQIQDIFSHFYPVSVIIIIITNQIKIALQLHIKLLNKLSNEFLFFAFTFDNNFPFFSIQFFIAIFFFVEPEIRSPLLVTQKGKQTFSLRIKRENG
jgi:hypothetical protein